MSRDLSAGIPAEAKTALAPADESRRPLHRSFAPATGSFS